jgi:ribosome-associated translation inhibitor RaiA
MQVPLQVSFKSIPNTTVVEGLIRQKAHKLERVCDHLSSCRVAVERPPKHPEDGNPYRVRIDMTVPPGHEVVVRNEPGRGKTKDPLDVVIRDAFDTASRRLRKVVALQQDRGKGRPHR